MRLKKQTILLFLFLPLCLFSLQSTEAGIPIGYSTGKNYIATHTYTSPDSTTYLDVIQYYDGLNRLLSATYTNNSGGDGKRFDESYDYDKMGNMTYLGRYDSYYGPVMDAAIISYEGNRLSRLDEYGYPYKGLGYCWEEEQFAYNRNAALTKDAHRGVDSIRYNYMNLPQKIWFDNGKYNYSL